MNHPAKVHILTCATDPYFIIILRKFNVAFFAISLQHSARLNVFLRTNLFFVAFESHMNEPAWLNIRFAVRAFALQRWLLLLVEVNHLVDAFFVENMLRGAFRAAECNDLLILLEPIYANAAFLRLFRLELFLCVANLYLGAYALEFQAWIL